MVSVSPCVQIEMEASIVDGDTNDQDRWYFYRAGISIGDDGGDPETASLQLVDSSGFVTTLQGPSGISHATASDSFGGQAGSLHFSLSGLGARLVSLIRPMDRFRIVVLVPGHDPWVCFDGPVRAVHSAVRSGSGWQASFTVSGGCLQQILSAAIFNWQGFVHPDKTILLTTDGQPLMEVLGKSALEPHKVIEAFLKSAVNTSMGIKIGSLTGGAGLGVQEYAMFIESPHEFSSWVGVCYPEPWSLIATQGKVSSIWSLAEAVAEPVLHEFFVGYRNPPDGGLARPTLIHRPRPFPGSREYDANWDALRVVKVGGPGMPGLMSISESLSSDRRANCFHWGGLGVGDNSKQAFEGKLFWGWVASHSLINRFGYCSVPVHSKIAPLGPGAPIKDYMDFSKTHLLHYAKQEMPLPLLKSRNIDAVFLPVRPGDVLEDHSLGSDMGSIVTGYVVATDWSLSSSPDGFAMSASASVERCLRGTDKVEYPAAVRALVDDVQAYSYTKGSGESGGSMPPAPVVDKSYSPPAAKPSKPEPIDSKVEAAIKAAASREGIPAWVIAHILQNETGFGRFWGDTPGVAKAKGIGQITTIAVQELVNHGYTNPDGSLFRSSDRGDVWKGIHATARLIKLARTALEAAPGAYPFFAGVDASWPWICRAYRWGAGSTRSFGSSVGWKWPVDGEAFPDFKRYWAPAALQRAKELWRYLG